MSHLPAARFIFDPTEKNDAIAFALAKQKVDRARDHNQWVLGMDSKAKKRIRRNRLAHLSRRQQWT